MKEKLHSNDSPLAGGGRREETRQEGELNMFLRLTNIEHLTTAVEQ